MNDCKYFFIIAVETTDITSIEQFSLCVRYYSSVNYKICKDFLKFVTAYDACGKS